MKRVILVILIVLACTTGCTIDSEATKISENDILETKCTVSPETTETDEKDIIQNCLNKYYAFLNGEISVSYYENENIIYDIDDIFGANDNYNRFTFFDSGRNGIPDLHLQSTVSYIIAEYVNDALVMLYYGSGYDTLYNNGDLLSTIEGLAPPHIMYKYTSLDSENTIHETYFEKYDGDYDGDYDYFLYEGEEITKSEYEELTEYCFSLQTDRIIWSNYWTFLFENANRN